MGLSGVGYAPSADGVWSIVAASGVLAEKSATIEKTIQRSIFGPFSMPPYVLELFGGGMCARTGCGRPARRWYCSDECGNAARQQRHRAGAATQATSSLPPDGVEITVHVTIAEWCVSDDAVRYKHMEGYRQTASGRWGTRARSESDADLVNALLDLNGGGGEL